ncbi:MAG: sigma factor-like helix-turn-helix DNA-binding protein [Clostridia bacterium]|nr:sigma factor-like helix-turn-helix DNA-binding protein [Clostridia bacterium]MDY6185330.1 sigma factor-like helix-turn-helix DNA-binding protein [Eubacteriales bacterium]
MFEKDLHMAYLLDFYGEVLPEKIRRVMELYYDEDLSLAEIAPEMDISRQGVRHLIKRGEEELTRLEAALGLASRYSELQSAADALEKARDAHAGVPLPSDVEEAITRCIRLIHNA